MKKILVLTILIMLIYKRNFHLNCMVCEYSTVYYNNYVAAIEIFQLLHFLFSIVEKYIIFNYIKITNIYKCICIYKSKHLSF